MARARKVFRTAAGFHDAYVAAPSQKAALEAWGSASDLFASGLAEVVTDAKLTNAALAKPGQVIRLPRGTAAQHLAALPRTMKLSPKSASAREPKSHASESKARPSRQALDAAETAMSRAEGAYRSAVDAIKAREDALRQERQALNAKHEEDLAKLSRKRNEARDTYERDLDRWLG